MQENNLPQLTAENAELVMISLLVARSQALELDAIETAMYANISPRSDVLIESTA